MVTFPSLLTNMKDWSPTHSPLADGSYVPSPLVPVRAKIVATASKEVVISLKSPPPVLCDTVCGEVRLIFPYHIFTPGKSPDWFL